MIEQVDLPERRACPLGGGLTRVSYRNPSVPDVPRRGAYRQRAGIHQPGIHGPGTDPWDWPHPDPARPANAERLYQERLQK